MSRPTLTFQDLTRKGNLLVLYVQRIAGGIFCCRSNDNLENVQRPVRDRNSQERRRLGYILGPNINLGRRGKTRGVLEIQFLKELVEGFLYPTRVHA